MLKITVVAVGKLKEKFWVAACDEYLKRLRPYAKVTVAEIPDVDPARAGGVEATREREGAGILAAVPEGAHVILMAIEGKQRSSVDFSRHLDDLALRGASELAFVIGGSDGVSPGRRDVLLRPHHPAPQPGPRRAARAALPRLQNLPRRALPQVGSLLDVQSKVGKRCAQFWAEARLPSSYTGLIRQEGAQS